MYGLQETKMHENARKKMHKISKMQQAMYAQEDGVTFQGLKKERVFAPVFFFGAASCVWARTALVLQGLKQKKES